jgi:predicted XRE-type DNA-binding protein
MDERQTSRVVRDAIRALTRAYSRIVEHIDATTDHQQAFRDATEASEALRKMYDHITAIRANTVLQIKEAEQLSLARLATQIGVSKSRANEIIRTAKAARKAESPGRRTE